MEEVNEKNKNEFKNKKIIKKGKKRYIEHDRYFLGQEQLFNMKLDATDGKMKYQDKFELNERGKPRDPTKKTNIMQKNSRNKTERAKLQSNKKKHKKRIDASYDVIRSNLTRYSNDELRELLTIEQFHVEDHDYWLNKKELKRLKQFIKLILNNLERREEIIQNFTPIYRYKYKYNRLTKEISRLYDKERHRNKQVVDYSTHYKTEIMKYHGVSIIKEEDLSWTSHSSKSKVGKKLSSMQVHWVHSRQQEAMKHRCKMNGWSFIKVNPRGTSYYCFCGNDDRNNRNGKRFKCTECGYQLDSDLKASRDVTSRTGRQVVKPREFLPDQFPSKI